ncbi:MAG: ETC complex I subunit [Pseudomonadota bacterium]
MTAKILKPAKTAMQSGKAKTENWVLEFEPEQRRKIDPLMGYTASSDMRSQIRLEFETLQAAIDYAEKNGIAYSVQKPQKAKRRTMAYADNFKHDRSLPWTH